MTKRNANDRDTAAAETDNTSGSGHAQPTDAGRTSGGGNLGHDQPDDVEAQTHTRNAGHRPTRSKSDPVMPHDDATLKTKL